MLTWLIIPAALAAPADVALLALDGPKAPGLSLQSHTLQWAGGTIVRFSQSISGIPVLGPAPRVTMDTQANILRRYGAPLTHQPDTLSPSLSRTAAITLAQDAVFADPALIPFPSHARLSITGANAPHLVWAVSVAKAQPFQTWDVLIDAIDGTVRGAQMSTLSVDGTVFPSSPMSSDPHDVPLQNLTRPDRLAGVYAEAFSCIEWEIDPKPFGQRDCLAIEPTAQPDHKGNYLYDPTYGSLDDPFAEVQAYHHTDLISTWADEWWGIRPEQPIRVITNFPLTNAFYGDFDGDGVRDTSYGISDDGFNFAYDSDVVYHEYGHAIVRLVAGSMGMKADSIGIDWTSGALNEGTADIFALVLNGDPLLAEYLGQSERWDTAIRDLEPDRSCPNDLQSQVHRSGEVLGALGWNLIEVLGTHMTAELLVGALGTWSNQTAWADAGQSLEDSADALLAASAIDLDAHARTRALIAQSGVPHCSRIIDLAQAETSTQILLNLGLNGPDTRFPAGVQLSLIAPTSATAIELEILEFDGAPEGTGWTVYVRAGQPVEHLATQVEGVGLPTAHAQGFDLQVDGTDAGTIRIDSDSALRLDPGEVYYFALASNNLSRTPLDIDYAKISVAGRALMGRLGEQSTAQSAGCTALPTPPHPWWPIATLLVGLARRKDRAADRSTKYK